MHQDVDLPADLAPLVANGEAASADCFRKLEETVGACSSIGYEILECDYAPEARTWWQEYAEYDPGCQADDDGDRKAIAVDKGRWQSCGYVIARAL